MKKGAYLKENKSPHGYNIANRAGSKDCQQRKAMRLHKQRRLKQLLLCVAFLFTLLIILSIFLFASHQSSIEGAWYMDEVTVYKFDNDRKGALVLPSTEYSFTYTITDNTLDIRFDYEGAKDAKYTFVIDGDSLILEGGNVTTQGTYVLTKDE